MCEAAGQTLVFGNKLSLQSDWPHSQGRGSSKSANTQHTHTGVHKHGRARFQTHLTKNALYFVCIPYYFYALKYAHAAYLRTCTVQGQTHTWPQAHTHNACTVQMQANTLLVTHWAEILCVKEGNGKANSFLLILFPQRC